MPFLVIRLLVALVSCVVASLTALARDIRVFSNWVSKTFLKEILLYAETRWVAEYIFFLPNLCCYVLVEVLSTIIIEIIAFTEFINHVSDIIVRINGNR